MNKRNELINVGDKVRVDLSLGGYVTFEGTVLYVPCSSGDCWHFKDNAGFVRYVQTFIQILKL